MNRVIGPFLGARGPGRIRIVIGLPDSHYDSLTCELMDSRGLQCGPPLESRPISSVFKCFVFDVEDLAENEKYTYVFKDDNGSVDLGSGLGEADCYFRGPAEFGDEDYFLLLSCNDPFAANGKSTGAPWAMWNRLEEDTRGDENCRLLLLGGDQVYCDELERQKEGKGFIKKLEKSGDVTSVEVKLRDAFIQQYHKYWSHDSLRKVFARIPSLAMWDDHDITDGWGSRLESFDGTEIKPSWRRYFNIAREAFEAYQAVRNPVPITSSGYTSYLDVGRLRFYMMDFRSERNASKAQLWSEDSHNDFLKNLAEIPQDTEKVFVLSPVVALRCNFEGDKRLSRVSEMLFSFRRWMMERPWTGVLRFLAMADLAALAISSLALVLQPSLLAIAEDSLIAAMRVTSVFVMVTGVLAIPAIACLLAMLLPRIPELPDIADDLNDSLTSEENRNTFTNILKRLFALCDQGKYVAILAGDIHVGGLSEFIRTKPGSIASIPQIVSSPVGSMPMPKAVEGLTTTTSEMRMWSDREENCYGKNLFYQSKRNYVKIYPHRLGSASGKPLLYYFEGHTEPTVLHDSMRPAD